MTDYTPTPQEEFWLAMCESLSSVEYTSQQLQKHIHGMTVQQVIAWAEQLERHAATSRAALQNVMAADWRQYEMALETRH